MGIEHNISIRALEEHDIVSIIDYFLNANMEYLHGMGVDPGKLPDKTSWVKRLVEELSVPIESKNFYFVIWLLDGVEIGHSNLSNIIYNEEAFMHLHMWNSSTRKKGIGTNLMRITLKHYFEDIKLNNLYCEPYALNPAPNRILEKVGFDFVKEYITTPGWLAFEQPVNRWVLSSEKFHLLNALQPTLENEKVKLKPLLQEDFDALYHVASDPLIWQQHPNRNRYKLDVFQTFFKGAMDSNGALLICDAQTDEPIGTTRFYDIDPKNKTVLIGYTFLSRAYWGKGYNSAAKELMINYAFTFVDKVIFHIGANNVRSQKAIEKIGAIKIGQQQIAYYGEKNNLNFIYQIEKKHWNTKYVPLLLQQNYKIRRAINSDIPTIKKVVFSVLEEYGLIPDETGVDKSLSDLESHYFENGGFFGVLVTEDNMIVGTIGTAQVGNGIFELKKMFLLKEHRGKGLGKLMMDFILQYLKDNNCRKIVLETVHVLEEAIGLYKRYGFSEVHSPIINNRVDQRFELKLE